jgi:hypothetical protein
MNKKIMYNQQQKARKNRGCQHSKVSKSTIQNSTLAMLR